MGSWVPARLKTLWWWVQQLVLRTLFLAKRDLRDPASVQRIGGVDVSFVKDSLTEACAALVVLDARTLSVVFERCERVALREPYVPGYLAFREVGFLLRLLRELRAEHPELAPELIMVDGNGILHPHGFGLASHLGVLAGIPTIGVGKSLHCVDGLTRESVRALVRERCVGVGDAAELVGTSGRVWGAALRTTDPAEGGDFKPLLISIGHGVTLETAVSMTRQCCRHRVPEPVRQADLRSREWLRRHA